MSLFTKEEICENCMFASFHECCGSFCRCLKGKEDMASGIRGECSYKETDKEENK